MQERTNRYLLALLLVIFVAISTAYMLVTPPFENPDESSHLTVVRYMAANRTLPPLVMPESRLDNGVAIAQYLSYNDPPVYYAPPLYYALSAGLTLWTDMSDLPDLLTPNPRWAAGYALISDTKSQDKTFYTHHPSVETWATSETARALYTLRGFSILLGIATIVCTYFIARELFPDQPGLWLGSAALLVVLPQFAANAAGVTNDNLNNVLFSLFILLTLRLTRQSAGWRGWGVAGVLLGLALLTKQSALLLLPIAGLAMLFAEWPQGEHRLNWRKLIGNGTSFTIAALLVGGWWYVRNWVLYADPVGLEPHYGTQPPLPHPFGFNELLSIWRTFYATFGWTLIRVESLAYIAAGIFLLVSFTGVLWSLRPAGDFWKLSGGSKRSLLLLAVAFGLNLASLVRWAIQTGSPYGRLLFPVVAAIMILAAWGFAQWSRWQPVRWLYAALLITAGLFSGLIPFHTLRPAFATPLTTDIPESAEQPDIQFNNQIRLLAYEAPDTDLRAGDRIIVTLYWRADQAVSERHRTWVQLGPWNGFPPLDLQDTWTGGSITPTDRWQAGDIIREKYTLTVPDWAAAPRLYWIRVGMVDETDQRIQLSNADNVMTLGPWDPTSGQAIIIGPWRLLPAQEVKPTCPLSYAFEAIQLNGYTITQAVSDDDSVLLQVTLYWQTDQVLQQNIITHVRLEDVSGEPIGQDNTAPKDGEYPSSWWLPGQIVPERYDFQLLEAELSNIEVQVIARPDSENVQVYNITTLTPDNSTGLFNLDCH